MHIPLFKPQLGSEELKGLKEIFHTGWVGLGPKTSEFETQFARFVGTKHAIGVNSCTAALHLALQVYQFPKESEVLLANINFISVPHAALYNNLKPVFVDVDYGTLCMDPRDLEKKISPRAKVILVTHLGGEVAPMEAVMDIAKKHHLVVIEDVANAVGGSYGGRMLGSIGDIGCHSFEAKKNMTTGDGGMITLNDDEKASTLRRLRWLGINKDTWKRFSENQGSYGWYYEVAELGYKYNMNDIMAVIGLAQLKKLPRFLTQKEKLIVRYNKELGQLPWITLPVRQPEARGAYWLYSIKVDQREDFMQYLSDAGITTGVHFMVMGAHPLYRTFPTDTPVADAVWKKIVSLPLYPSMTKTEQTYVIQTIKKFRQHA